MSMIIVIICIYAYWHANIECHSLDSIRHVANIQQFKHIVKFETQFMTLNERQGHRTGDGHIHL